MEDIRVLLSPVTGPLWAIHLRTIEGDFWILLTEAQSSHPVPLYRIIDQHVVSEPGLDAADEDDFRLADYLTGTVGDQVLRLATEAGVGQAATDFIPGQDLYWSLPEAATEVVRDLHILAGSIVQVGSADPAGWLAWKAKRQQDTP
jgi:hypothetical protein